MPNLKNYVRELYSIPGIARCVNIYHIKVWPPKVHDWHLRVLICQSVIDRTCTSACAYAGQQPVKLMMPAWILCLLIVIPVVCCRHTTTPHTQS